MKKTFSIFLSLLLIVLSFSSCIAVVTDGSFADEDILKKEIENYISDFDLNIFRTESDTSYTITLKVGEMKAKDANIVLDKTIQYLIPRMKDYTNNGNLGYKIWIKSDKYKYWIAPYFEEKMGYIYIDSVINSNIKTEKIEFQFIENKLMDSSTNEPLDLEKYTKELEKEISKKE